MIKKKVKSIFIKNPGKKPFQEEFQKREWDKGIISREFSRII